MQHCSPSRFVRFIGCWFVAVLVFVGISLYCHDSVCETMRSTALKEVVSSTPPSYENIEASRQNEAGHSNNSSSTKPIASMLAKDEIRRVAICVTGQPRTLNMSIHDPDYPISPKYPIKVAEAIQQHLYSVLESHGFDVFMYVSAVQRNITSATGTDERDRVRYPIPGDTTTCEPLRPTNTSNKLHCSVRPQPRLFAAFPETFKDVWNGGNNPNCVEQLLHQLRDQLLCLRQVEAGGGIARYSHMIRLRPDMQVTKPFPPIRTLDFGPPHKRKVFYPGTRHCCCGNQDYFSISTYDVMQTYFSRYITLQSLPAEITLQATEYFRGKWTAETFLAGELARVKNASLEGMHRIGGCIVKPQSRKSIGQE